MILVPPISTEQGRLYVEALPEATYELCSDFGVYVAVGYPNHSIVYRGVWDKAKQHGSWQFAYWRN